jgi:hypothetical protein
MRQELTCVKKAHRHCLQHACMLEGKCTMTRRSEFFSELLRVRVWIPILAMPKSWTSAIGHAQP